MLVSVFYTAGAETGEKVMMTHQEAIEILQKSNERLAVQIQNVKSTKSKVETAGLTDKYYSVLENCEKEYYACELAISSLKKQAKRKKPLTVEQLKIINADLENRRWVWIEALKPFGHEYKVSAYYQIQQDYTHGKSFCCGYPGLSFGFDYADYGKTWLAYCCKQEAK